MCVVDFFYSFTLPCAAQFLICAPTNGGLNQKKMCLLVANYNMSRVCYFVGVISDSVILFKTVIQHLP